MKWGSLNIKWRVKVRTGFEYRVIFFWQIFFVTSGLFNSGNLFHSSDTRTLCRIVAGNNGFCQKNYWPCRNVMQPLLVQI